MRIGRVLCRLGCHRWEEIGVCGPFPKLLSRCKRCGTGKLFDPLAFQSWILTPETVEVLTRKEPK